MTRFALTPLDLGIIIASVIFSVGVGFWASRRVEQTARGFFLASGKMPWWLIGAAFVSTSVSSEQIVGTVGAAYKHGMGIANWEWWCLPTYALVMIFFIPLYLKNRISTVPELLTRRFGPACGYVYSYVILFAYVFLFLTPALYGGSVTFSRLTGWPPAAVLAGIVLLVGFYTVLGGLSSVMWTDAVQCVMLVVGGVVLFFVALGHIPGGWPAMVQAAPERFHLYHPPADPQAPFLGLITATFGVFLFYQSTNQVMIQRVFAARSTWDGMMGIVFAGFINLLRPLVTCLLGLAVYHWIEKMGRAPSLLPDKQDQVFPFALEVFAPSGLRGVILAGFVAAIMSATSALANAAGTIFSLDVYRRLLRPGADDRGLIRAGRIASGAALILAALTTPLVPQLGGIFRYFQTGVTYMATPFVSVMLLGILWKRTNYAGAMAGLLGGLAIQIGLAVMLWAMRIELNWLYVGSIAQVLTMALIVLVTLLTVPAPEKNWGQFLWRPALLAQYDEGRPRPWYQQVKLWFGVYALAWCYVYWRFW
jgi:solute:Na+ symporter, SSS family